MTICNDAWITDQAIRGMINPFECTQVKRIIEQHDAVAHKVISYGCSSYGYDMRVGCHFKLYTNLTAGVVDPKNFGMDVHFHDMKVLEHESVIIPPNSFALASSVEYFKIPRDVMTIVLGKSTYARCGLVVNITALEPEWEGQVTIEISNTTPLPVKVYAGEGIAQVLFFRAEEECLISYADRQGKYQGQTGITLPKA